MVPRTALAQQVASKQHALATHKTAQAAHRTAKKAHKAAADGREAAQRASIIIEAARQALKEAMSETKTPSEAGVIRINKAAAIKETRYEHLRREIAP